MTLSPHNYETLQLAAMVLLSQPRPIPILVDIAKPCIVCGFMMSHSPHYYRRKYCSYTCTKRFYRQKRKHEQ